MGKPAARLTDFHMCPMQTPATPPIPHVGGPIMSPGAPTVLIGGLPAATVGDMCTCVGPPDTILPNGCMVLICGKPAARMGDKTAHGGTIMMGCMTVLIGESGGGGGGGGASGGANTNAGAGSAAGQANNQALKKAAENGEEETPRTDKNDFKAQFELLDEAGKGVKDVEYEITTSDGQTHKGKTDASGKTENLSGYTTADCRCIFKQS